MERSVATVPCSRKGGAGPGAGYCSWHSVRSRAQRRATKAWQRGRPAPAGRPEPLEDRARQEAAAAVGASGQDPTSPRGRATRPSRWASPPGPAAAPDARSRGGQQWPAQGPPHRRAHPPTRFPAANRGRPRNPPAATQTSGPATARATFARSPAPPCRRVGACSRTHPCAVRIHPDAATSPRVNASIVDKRRDGARGSRDGADPAG